MTTHPAFVVHSCLTYIHSTSGSEPFDRVPCSLEVLSRLATRTSGSRSRRFGRGASFQKDIHGIHEALFKRIGPLFPPSANPVSGNKYEHPFHHFRETQRFTIGANFAALLAL